MLLECIELEKRIKICFKNCIKIFFSVIGAKLELMVFPLPVFRYDMLELPEECPDYDYGLKVRSKEQQAAVDTAVAGN